MSPLFRDALCLFIILIKRCSVLLLCGWFIHRHQHNEQISVYSAIRSQRTHNAFHNQVWNGNNICPNALNAQTLTHQRAVRCLSQIRDVLSISYFSGWAYSNAANCKQKKMWIHCVSSVYPAAQCTRQKTHTVWFQLGLFDRTCARMRSIKQLCWRTFSILLFLSL